MTWHSDAGFFGGLLLPGVNAKLPCKKVLENAVHLVEISPETRSGICQHWQCHSEGVPELASYHSLENKHMSSVVYSARRAVACCQDYGSWRAV